MTDSKYSSIWLLLIQIEPEEGFRFNDLVDSDNLTEVEYKGAWANVLVKANSIAESIEIAPRGLAEKNFKTIHIDKSENISSLLENNELNNNVQEEVEWLLSSDYVFMISDRIFPYSNEQNTTHNKS